MEADNHAAVSAMYDCLGGANRADFLTAAGLCLLVVSPFVQKQDIKKMFLRTRLSFFFVTSQLDGLHLLT